MRKCALQLLSKLLCFNPFGQFLPLDQLVASLNEYKTKLQVMRLLWFATSSGGKTHLAVVMCSASKSYEAFLFLHKGCLSILHDM